MQKHRCKGLILAGGKGTRLSPLTRVTNKHLLPVGDKPMIYHPIERMVEAGIEDIMVVTGVEHAGAVMGLLGSGREFNCHFTYRVQDEAGGIAQALGLARGFAANSRLCVILGDNIFFEPLTPWVDAFVEKDDFAQLVLKEVDDPQRFGVADVDGQGKIFNIVEKPKDPPSDWAVTGIYFYPSDVFDVVPTLKPSGRGELEITDVNNHYVQAGRMQSVKMQGPWTDAGTFASLRRASELAVEMGQLEK